MVKCHPLIHFSVKLFYSIKITNLQYCCTGVCLIGLEINNFAYLKTIIQLLAVWMNCFQNNSLPQQNFTFILSSRTEILPCYVCHTRSTSTLWQAISDVYSLVAGWQRPKWLTLWWRHYWFDRALIIRIFFSKTHTFLLRTHTKHVHVLRYLS